MSKEALRRETRRLCSVAGKLITESRILCDFAYHDVIDEKPVLKNVKIVGSTENVEDVIALCNDFKEKHRPNELLQFVGENGADSLFGKLSEDTRLDVRFDFLTYFKFFKSVIGLDFTSYLDKEKRTWNNHIAQFPKHIPVRLRRRESPLENRSLKEYLKDFLKPEHDINLEICYGEYGVGKTTFVLELQNTLARNWLNAPTENRIPIRIALIDYRKSNQIEDLVKRTVTQSNDPFVSDEIFWRMVEAGFFIFLLDGVDEMFDLGTSEELQRNQLKELLRLQFWNGDLSETRLLQEARTLWTCRTTYFDSYEEIGNDESVGAILEKIRHKKDLFISSFDPMSVQEQIETESPELWELVQQIFGLAALAQTALWFQMVLKTLLVKVNNGETIVSTRLIDEFIEAAILRETSEKKRSFDRAQHEAAIEWLACELHAIRFSADRQERAVGLTARDIAERLLEYAQERRFARDGFADLMKFEYEVERLFQAVRFCSFLSRYDSSDIGYYFYPEPFESYFVAMRLWKKDYRNQTLDIDLYFSSPKEFAISNGVCHFLYDEFSYANATGTLSQRLITQAQDGWIVFPAGLFIYWDSESQRDLVRRLDSFAMREHPVTVREYRKFLDENPEVEPPSGWGQGEYEQLCPSDECPVVKVTYDDAARYCEWLGQKENCEVRLPTDQQWQRAARGMDGRVYHWGMSLPDQPKAVCNGLEYWNSNAGNAKTTPVGIFRWKPFGLSDLIGNVWEYTCEQTGERVLTRGGSFYTDHTKWKIRTINRDEECKFLTDKKRGEPDVGFRPVKLFSKSTGK
jgi:hypothetical protein